MKRVFLLLLMGLFGTALFAQTQINVTYKELPKDVQKYISKNFNGYAVDKAVEGQVKGKASYFDVTISKGTEKHILTFDKDGNFVKKDAVAEQPKEQPKEAAKPADTVKKK